MALTDADEEELRTAAGKGGKAVHLSPSSGGGSGSTQARLLTLMFRKEKVRVLDEAIARFGRLTGKGTGGGVGSGSEGKAVAASAAGAGAAAASSSSSS